MGAPAVAPRRAPAHRAPARKPSASARPQLRRAAAVRPAAAAIPYAAVRGAGVVRDISDSGLIVRLTQGRSWIAVLCALLGGIVALNVISLSINAGSGRVAQEVAALERSNSALRAELANSFTASRVEEAAANLGLAVPAPEEVGYLTASDDAYEKLLALIRNETVLTRPGPAAVTSGTSANLPGATTEAPVATAPAPETTVPAVPAPAPDPSAPAPSASGGVGL